MFNLENNSVKVRIKLFNYADIQCNRKSIFKEKQLTAKLKSLLQYFIINKGIICKPEKIIEELWPENEYIERKKVLQTYVHRLRNALIKENSFDRDFSEYIVILNNKGNYQMEISDAVELDTEIFIDITRKVNHLEDYESLIKAASDMSAIYDGHYLLDSRHEKLILRQQNYYLQAYCGAMHNILNKLTEMEKYYDVISLCENFFMVEELDDSINTAFINALVKTQQVTYAIRHYTYIEKKMLDTFGISPSGELLNLYTALKDNHEVPVSQLITGGEKLDEDRIRNIINNLVVEKLRENQVKYSFAQIKIINGKNKDIPEGMMEDTLLNSLRKNDMFTLVDNKTAMALLYEAREEYFDKIAGRIISFADMHYPDVNAKVDVLIWPITNII